MSKEVHRTAETAFSTTASKTVDPVMPAIARHKAAVAAYDALEDKLACGDIAPPLLEQARAECRRLMGAQDAALVALIKTKPATVPGAAAFALHAIEYALPWADEQDRPLLKAVLRGLRKLGVHAHI